jgi:hypothetical protein
MLDGCWKRKIFGIQNSAFGVLCYFLYKKH